MLAVVDEPELPERLPMPPVGALRELGFLRVELSALDRLGPPHAEDDPEEHFRKYGLPPSPGRDWWLRARCGVEFLLWQDFVDEQVIVGGDETAEFAHIVAHLPFPSEVTWRCAPQADEEARRSGKGGWQVWRIDDRGNRFELECLSRERSARCYAALLEARGHKQSYFVEQRGELPEPPPPEQPPYRWALFRQDEHGRRYLVRRGPNPVALRFLADYFNREPRHKQFFFVEPYAP
jgi:hypothetical protein